MEKQQQGLVIVPPPAKPSLFHQQISLMLKFRQESPLYSSESFMELWETLSNTLDSTLMSCGGGGGGEEGIMIAIDFPPPNSPSTSLGLLNRKGSLSKPFSSSTTPKQKKEKNTQPSMPPVDNTDQSNIILPVIPPYLPRTPNSTKNDQNRLPSSSAVQQKVGSNNITFKNIPTPPIFSVIKQDDAKKTESPSSSSSSSENKTTTKPSPPPSQFYPSSTNELLKLIDLHASSVPKYMKPPKAPFFGYGSVDSFTTAYKLKIIQNYLSEIGYNHLGYPFFEIKKTFSLRRIHLLAREMINEALPIKCLEAVILSIHLTDCLSGTDRFVLSFKSEVDECNVYRHVVLVIREGDKYGAVGLSRRADLMFKPLVFNSLQDLILNYKEAYEGNFHALRKIKLGFPIPFGVTSTEKVVWKYSSISMNGEWSDISRKLDVFTRNSRKSLGSLVGLADSNPSSA